MWTDCTKPLCYVVVPVSNDAASLGICFFFFLFLALDSAEVLKLWSLDFMLVFVVIYLLLPVTNQLV